MSHRMRLLLVTNLGLGCAGALGGCRDDAPPPQRVPVPAASNRDQLRERDYVKPMPDPVAIDTRTDSTQRMIREGPPRTDTHDVPPRRDTRDTRETTETRRRVPDDAQVAHDFVDAYHKVGEPRFLIFVNRTLDGEVIPVNDYQDPNKTKYLRPGEYDEANARSIDYQALENQLAETFGQGSQVMVISPTVAREKLGEAPVKDLQDGHSKALEDLDKRLGADVLIQVQMHPTRQTARGLDFRVVAESINVKGGQSVGHAFADVERPLDQDQIRAVTRYLSTKLMADMITVWSAPPPGGTAAPEQATPRDSAKPLPPPTPAPNE